MMKIAMGLGLVAVFAFSAPAFAFSATDVAGAAKPQIVYVSGGCGPYAHRGPYGGCQPGGQFGVERCPRGYHLGPYGRRCVPNRF